MYRIAMLSLFLVAIGVHGAHAQAREDSSVSETGSFYPLVYEGVLKTNPLSMLWGSIPLSAEYMGIYEFISSPQQSSQVGLSFITKSPILRPFEDTIPDLELLTANGIRFQLSHRFFLTKKRGYAPDGFYVSPHISYATVKVSTKHFSSRDVYIRVTHFNANLLAGWQYIFERDYVIDTYVGLGYKDNIWEEHDSQTTISLDNDDLGGWYSGPLKVSFGFHLGIAF